MKRCLALLLTACLLSGVVYADTVEVESGFFPAATLTGIRVPVVAEGTAEALPVLMKLDNAALPADSPLAAKKVGKCFVVGEAETVADSERVTIKLASLFCLDDKDTVTVEAPVEGVFIDSRDGGVGVQGQTQRMDSASIEPLARHIDDAKTRAKLLEGIAPVLTVEPGITGQLMITAPLQLDVKAP